MLLNKYGYQLDLNIIFFANFAQLVVARFCDIIAAVLFATRREYHPHNNIGFTAPPFISSQMILNRYMMFSVFSRESDYRMSFSPSVSYQNTSTSQNRVC